MRNKYIRNYDVGLATSMALPGICVPWNAALNFDAFDDYSPSIACRVRLSVLASRSSSRR